MPRFVEPVWECSDDIVELLITAFPEVLGLPDHNFQTALGKAIEYNKLEMLEYFGDPEELKGAVFQWVRVQQKCFINYILPNKPDLKPIRLYL